MRLPNGWHWKDWVSFFARRPSSENNAKVKYSRSLLIRHLGYYLDTLKNNKLITFFLIALLLHFSLLISFAIKVKPKKFDSDLQTLPAYIYHEEKYHPLSQVQLPIEHSEPEKLTSKNGIEKPIREKSKIQQARSETLSLGNGQQNVNLTLKSKNLMDKPLLNLISKAVSAHLTYPKIAMDFRLRGKALVGFVIHPDGHLTDLTLLQSSGTEVLDQAAMESVKAISPLKNVNFYITKAESLMMGIIFQ